MQAREDQEKKEKEMQKTTPHFWNLNEDPQLSGKVRHFIKAGNYFVVVSYIVIGKWYVFKVKGIPVAHSVVSYLGCVWVVPWFDINCAKNEMATSIYMLHNGVLHSTNWQRNMTRASCVSTSDLECYKLLF